MGIRLEHPATHPPLTTNSHLLELSQSVEEHLQHFNEHKHDAKMSKSGENVNVHWGLGLTTRPPILLKPLTDINIMIKLKMQMYTGIRLGHPTAHPPLTT